ncbi:hypothetical protein [Chitinophaga barathri]|nr:hypothetical protein [Chitinophaga barathri]
MQRLTIMLTAALFVAFTACKKEYEQYHHTHIISFTIADVNGSPVKALTDSGRISISWLHAWPLPDSVTPEIVLPEGAVITPASGTKVPLKEGFIYTITAADGTKQTWKLKLDIRQAEPVMTIQPGTVVRTGSVFTISGNNFVEDLAQTSLFLVDKNGADTIRLPVTALTFQSVSVTIPATVDTGSYYIKMISGIKTAYSASVKVMYPLPVITWSTGTTYKRGETVTLKGTGLRNITGVGLGSTAIEGPFHALEVISHKIDEITLKIPADFPQAPYFMYIQYQSAATGTSTSYVFVRIAD